MGHTSKDLGVETRHERRLKGDIEGLTKETEQAVMGGEGRGIIKRSTFLKKRGRADEKKNTNSPEKKGRTKGRGRKVPFQIAQKGGKPPSGLE